VGASTGQPGSGGVDGENLGRFGSQLDQELDRLHTELKQNTYRPQPVRQVPIPKPGKPGEFRTLGIRRFMTGYANKRCLIGWNRSSSRSSMRPTSDTGEGDR
jgi:hypothetical protein